MIVHRVHCSEFIGVATNSTYVLPIHSWPQTVHVSASGVVSERLVLKEVKKFVCLLFL